MSWGFYDDESDWGAGLTAPRKEFPKGQRVAVKTDLRPRVHGRGPERITVATDEVGVVTRQGSAMILVRLVHRRQPVSVYIEWTELEPLVDEE